MHKKLNLIFGAAALLLAMPLSAAQQGDEPTAVPTSVKQGIDFAYVDPQLSYVVNKNQKPRNWLRGGTDDPDRNANLVLAQLSHGLDGYRSTWGALPQAQISSGTVLKPGSTDPRVDQLRTRLGLAPGGGYDNALSRRVSDYQRVHALAPVDGIAGNGTIASLNRGADYYERLIAINMERASRLPKPGIFDRYVMIDSGSAIAYLFDNDKSTDRMRVVVGSNATKTPMMATVMNYAKANPYWHVPPELIRTLTAKRIEEQGLSYLQNFHYEVLSDWTADAEIIDPKTVNWQSIADGRTKPTVLVRQLPGPWNSMGKMKFEVPNDFGIYLHDSPHTELYAQDDRWLSNGCVRLQDYRRFATWVFGQMPKITSAREELLQLPKSIPIYMTYLTVQPDNANGVTFRPDPYGFDALAMPQMDFDNPA